MYYQYTGRIKNGKARFPAEPRALLWGKRISRNKKLKAFTSWHGDVVGVRDTV